MNNPHYLIRGLNILLAAHAGKNSTPSVSSSFEQISIPITPRPLSEEIVETLIDLQWTQKDRDRNFWWKGYTKDDYDPNKPWHFPIR